MVSDFKKNLIKGVKSPRQNKFFLTDLLHLFTPFTRLFALTIQSPMSKLFRFSESLKKSNGKKGLQFFFCSLANFVLLAGFFWFLCYYQHWSRDALSPVCRIFLGLL